MDVDGLRTLADLARVVQVLGRDFIDLQQCLSLSINFLSQGRAVFELS